MRPLGIASVADRVVQQALKIVIEPIVEADFLPCSYGFRPKRSAHDARQRCALYLSNGIPAQRGALLHDDDFTIVAKYGAEYAGLVQYYLLAQDVFRLGRLRWTMETSMLKTLAAKHRSTVTKMARRYKTTIESPTGPRTVFQVTVERDRGRKPLVARFGGILLRRADTAVLTDQRPVKHKGSRPRGQPVLTQQSARGAVW